MKIHSHRSLSKVASYITKVEVTVYQVRYLLHHMSLTICDIVHSYYMKSLQATYEVQLLSPCISEQHLCIYS